MAVSLLPREFFAGQKDHDAVLFLEQVAPGRFERHSLKRGGCDHATVAAGDLSGEGRIDFVTGNFTFFEKMDDSVTVWRNRGKRSNPACPDLAREFGSVGSSLTERAGQESLAFVRRRRRCA